MSDSRPSPGLDARVDAAWPEAADYLDEHPDRLERVSRALVERVLAAADHVPSPRLDEFTRWRIQQEATERQLEGELAEAREENERLREALEAVTHYVRMPHQKIGEACGVDLCVACLIEGTAREALGLPEGQSE